MIHQAGWRVQDERTVYAEPGLRVCVAEVELPDGRRIDHRLVRTVRSAGAVVLNDRHHVLLIRRHRFITGSWGWEIPSGRIAQGETPRQAAARQVESETGWRPGPLRPLAYSEPSSGLVDSQDHAFLATSATYVGPPAGTTGAQRIAWIPLADVLDLIRERQIVSGPTLVALLQVLADPELPGE